MMSSNVQVAAASVPVSKPPKRRNTTKACEECRRRRAKCDGKKPSCSRCITRSIACQYGSKEDGRRPASMSYVLLLRQRITILEDALRANSIDINSSTTRPLEANESISAKDMAGASHTSNSLDNAGINCTARIEDLCQKLEGALSLDDTLNWDQDGEVHYFGPTSGRLEFLESSGDELPKPSLNSFRENNIVTDPILQNVPEELQLHLIDLYFAWANSWYPVVNEVLFRESLYSGNRYCSPILLLCILGVGARLTDRPQVRSDPADHSTAGKVFLERAEALLPLDMKSPKITTIQSLAIMSILYCAFGSDAACWLHEGMACRLMLDMGLNIDAGSLAGSKAISAEEIELRRQIYWALYATDKFSAGYTGRACTMMSFQGAVELPSIYRSPEPSVVLDTAMTRQNDTMIFLGGQAKLCQILEEILLNLYAPRPAISGAQRAVFLTTCTIKLKNWAYDLPSELRLDRRPGTKSANKRPHVYTLHMMYHTTYILLAKPFLKDKEVDPSNTDEASRTAVQTARALCLEATKAIVFVSRRYRQVFGSFRKSPITATHCSLSGAVALLSLIQTNGMMNYSEPTNLLDTILGVLEELSTSWDIARRLRNNLLRLCRAKKIPTDGLDQTTSLEAATAMAENPWSNVQDMDYITSHNGLDTAFSADLSAAGFQDFGNWLDMIDETYLEENILNGAFLHNDPSATL